MNIDLDRMRNLYNIKEFLTKKQFIKFRRQIRIEKIENILNHE